MRAITLFLVGVLFPTSGFAEDATQITWSVSGTVKDVQQAVAKFSQNMVAFGDPTVASPFDVKCSGLDPEPKDPKELGSSRWLGPKEWAYDFVKPLPAGVKCEFTLKSGVKNLAGKAVTAAGPYGFSTGGPAIRSTRPWEGSRDVQEDQAFVLELDAAPDRASVNQHAYFEIAGQGNRVGIKWITGSDRKAVLKAAYREDKENLIVIQAEQKFPPDTKIALVWGKGIKSASGVATDKDQTIPFSARENFKAEFRCERENPAAGCSPVGYIQLRFSSNVRAEDAEKVRIKTDKGELQREKTRNEDREEWTQTISFKGPFPETTSLTVEIPKGITDDAGRKLINADKFPLKTKTDRFPPLAKFPASFGILEAGKPALLPVTIRNLEPDVKTRLFRSSGRKGVSFDDMDKVEGKQAKVAITKKTDILEWIRRVEKNQYEYSVFETQPRKTYKWDKAGNSGKYVDVMDPPPEKVTPKSFPVPRKEKPKSFEVVGIPLEEPGFYVVEVDSSALGQALNASKKNYHAVTSVLVTDLAVHFKWGRESSLAWVTRLKDGAPVANARVEVTDCNGKLIDAGKSDTMGVALLAKVPREVAKCHLRGDYHKFSEGLLVTAELGNDMSFVHTSMNDGIENWRFSLSSDSSHDPVLAHSVLDRALFRAGETLHMKTFLRRHSSQGIGAVTAADKPTKFRIRHAGSDQKFEFPIKWEPTGYFAAEWKIPKDAKLGHYYIELLGKGKRFGQISAGTFRVEEFRVPLLKGSLQSTETLPVRPKQLTFDASVQYQAGGPALGLPVKLRFHQIPDQSVSLEDFSDFAMANGSVKEGRKKRGGDEEDEANTQTNGTKVETLTGELDATGGKRFVVKGLVPKDNPYRILTELEFADPNGEIQTQSMTQTVYPSSALVGVKADSWVASKDQLKVSVAVANIDGKPIANRKVEVVLFEKKIYSHRKRLVGGYYAYENVEEIKKLGSFCDGETNVRGILICEAKPPQSGNLIAQAVVADSKGNQSFAHTDVWVPGAEEWWFPVSDNDRMDLIPERKRYEPGEKAKIQVRSPFREATLLVTVEREGVLESFVQKVSGKAPVIEVPLANRYAPNAFISVLAVRGRSGDSQPTALVDLGKPAYKLGITQVDVGWGSHELKVKVTTPKPVFRVREKVPVEVTVLDPTGKAMKNADVTIAAVDEGLLSLMPNDTWDLLTHMMQRRPYEVENSTASMHVIGKRHFGLKALPAGGGGGNQPTRELFDTLLYWKASIKTDAKGKAKVQVPLNDSLTSFRIVAIAAADVDKFGTGKTNVRTHQDLMLFSGVSPLAREGDNTEALLTVRNASEGPLTVNASVSVEGLKEKLAPKKATLKAGESKIFTWGIPVPNGVESLAYTFDATTSSKAKDRVKFTQKVSPAVPVRVLQANLSQVDKPVEVPVEIPKTAIPGRGGIRVDLQPTLLAGAESIRSYMKEYPYSCMEQEVSRAVALRDEKRWKAVVKTMPMHLDGQGFLKYFPTMREGSEVLTAYVLAIAHEAGWEIPTNVQGPMVSALQSFVSGTVGRGVNSPAPDLVMRKITVLEALSRVPDAYPKGAEKSVEYSPNLWPTSSLIEWRNLLSRVETADKAAQWKEVNTILRARMNTQGTSLAFSTEAGDRLWWLMASIDTNAVRAVLSLADDAEWKDEMPRIMRGAIARQLRGHWDLTLANAWGVLALEKFAKKFEAGEITGSTQIALADQSKSKEWTKGNAETPPLMLAWPLAKGTLAMKHSGGGKPWAIFQSMAAIPLKEPLASGFRIEKTITAVERKEKGKWNVGDVIRVTVKVRSDADQTWVVVNDPIPAGASLLGGGLGNTSALLTKDEKSKGWAWPAFTERSFEGLRSYYEWIDKGEFTTEYTVRLNQAGKFSLPPTRVEAMYRPEAFGEWPNADWEIVR